MEDKYTLTDSMLFRNGQKQHCPYDSMDSARACGNWCPLFETSGALFSDSTENVILHCGGSRIITLSGK
jgi:hypothetical protein